MKPWSRHDPMDVDVSGTAQFEGRTAEEAVARARAALGDSGALRCWKTRRGGVGGFFAKEVFVAGLTPPPGSETTRGRASWAQPGPKGSSSAHTPLPDVAHEDGALSGSAPGPYREDGQDISAGPEDHLSGLIEATSDQVSLGSLAIPAEAFDEVLAEAQAALTPRARRKRHRHSGLPCESGTTVRHIRGARRPRAWAPPSRRRRCRRYAQRTRKGDRLEDTGIFGWWKASAIGATREEGDATKGKDRTHAACSAVQHCGDAWTGRTRGSDPGPETAASEPGPPGPLRAARTAPLTGPAGQCDGDPARAASVADPPRRSGSGHGVRSRP